MTLALGAAFFRIRSRFLRTTVPKIRGIPTRSLELESGCRQFSTITFSMAGGANRQDRVGQLLQGVMLVATSVAMVGVDRHGKGEVSTTKKHSSIAPAQPIFTSVRDRLPHCTDEGGPAGGRRTP
jgi:hypothetical protein